MDQFTEALGHAQITLVNIQNGPGKKPKASQQALARLKKASKISKIAEKIASSEDAKEIAAKNWNWEDLEHAIKTCTKCPHLVAARTQVVFGIGNRQADLLFVGEAPGAEEDVQGEPFVGKCSALLTKIIEAMGLTRESVFISNVLKCRPNMPAGEAGNRKPKSEEMATCLPWLTAQIRLVQPKVIVALGLTATEGLLGEPGLMRDIRGKWFSHADIPVLVTYHPAWLLRNQSLLEKRKVWEDMLLVMEKMNLPISDKQRRFFSSVEK